MRRQSGIILPIDPAGLSPDFILPEAVEDISEDIKRITFPGGFSCYAPVEFGEAALIYNEIMVKQEYFSMDSLRREHGACSISVQTLASSR